MACVGRVVRPICWRLPLAVILGLAAVSLGASTGTAAARSVTAGPPAAAGTARPPPPLVAGTDKGAARGLYGSNAREFFGIPYAAPPVGSLRWRPPQPAKPWTGV